MSDNLIPKNLFMAWGGSTPPNWCLKAFDEYKALLGSHWNCQFFNTLSVPQSYRLFKEQSKIPNFTYKADIFRLWLLEEYGGIWVDTDTRFIKPFDDLTVHEGIATVHRDTPQSPLDRFHIDSCMIGSAPKGKMIDLVVDRVYESLRSGKGYWQFTWNFNQTLTGNCPDYIYYGAFDEITTPTERERFMSCKFEKIVPKRSNSYIRHYLTNLYSNKESANV